MKQQQREPNWSIAEMEKMIHQERTIRQQAQIAAEQALTAAKEAQKMILQLEDELESMDRKLQQERAARLQAELVARKANAVAIKASQNESHLSGKEGERILKKNVSPAKVDSRVDDVIAAAVTKLPQRKRLREATPTQTSLVKKLRGSKTKQTHGESSHLRMSLAEARKVAREEVEKRTRERVRELQTGKECFLPKQHGHDTQMLSSDK